MAWTPLLTRVKESGLELLHPVTFRIRIDIQPKEPFAPVVCLSAVDCRGRRSICPEYPVLVAALADRVEKVELHRPFAPGVHLVRVQVGQHVVVLPCEGWNITQTVAGTVAIERTHRSHMVQNPEMGGCAESSGPIGRLRIDCCTLVGAGSVDGIKVLALGGIFSFEGEPVPRKIERCAAGVHASAFHAEGGKVNQPAIFKAFVSVQEVALQTEQDAVPAENLIEVNCSCRSSYPGVCIAGVESRSADCAFDGEPVVQVHRSLKSFE